MPSHRSVVGVTGGDQAAGDAHRTQGADRVRHVLEDLVSVDDVIDLAGVEGVHIVDTETEVGLVVVDLRLGDDVSSLVDTEDLPGRDTAGKVGGDRARPAAEVEERHAGTHVGEEIPGRVPSCSPAMGPQHAFVVAMGVLGVRHPVTVPQALVAPPPRLGRRDRFGDLLAKP